MILVSVVGIPSESRKTESVAAARTVALALAKKYPQQWVDARREDGELVHLIEPRSIVDDSEPEEPAPVLDEQEGLF